MGLLAKIDQTLRLRAALEDYVLTRPSPLFRPAFVLDERQEAEAQSAVAQIRQTGAFFAGVRISPERLTTIRKALADGYDGRRGELKVSVNQRTGIAHIHNPLRVCPEIIALAMDPFLCGIAERYLRRRVILADTDMRRVPPMEMREVDQRAGTKAVGTTSSHWHRDIRGRQVKVMFYLTDVAEKDSNFAFLPGTHKISPVRPRHLEESRFNEEWVTSSGIKPVECYGSAGTAMVFDTNFIHRLRRKPGAALRDSVTFYYTPGQETRFLDVDSGLIKDLPEAARSLFKGWRPAPGQPGDASV